jgi:pimeloyl-ACP methyl ester carboxylesterase
MPGIEINNTRLEYIEQGSGEPVVFVHGGLSDWRTWLPQIDQFSVHYHVVSYSRRYHWPNEAIPDNMDDQMMPHVNDLAELLRSLDIAPAHLIGNSWGAFICLMLALKQPQLVQTLTLGEPPVQPLLMGSPPKPLKMLKLFVSRPRTASAVMNFMSKGYTPAVKAFRKGEIEKGMEYFTHFVLGKEAYINIPEERKDQMRANIKPQIAEFLGAGFPPFTDDDARSIKAPALLVTGQNSPVFLLRMTDRLEELLPHAERTEIPDASHLMHEQNPGAYNEAVLGFLARH